MRIETLVKERNRITQILAGLLVVVALKQLYSTSSVDDLRWILAPTSFLVEIVSGARFSFESHAGYMSHDHTFVIAASCAGVNFLIAAFLLLAAKSIWKNSAWKSIPLSLLVAYFVTLIANTVRITIALWMQSVNIRSGWLNAKELHRLEGIVVFFGFLMLLFVAHEIFDQLKEGRTFSVRHFAQLIMFPLFVYYVNTLGLPLANGAFRNVEFWRHAVFVIVVPAFVLIPVASALSVWVRTRRQAII